MTSTLTHSHECRKAILKAIRKSHSYRRRTSTWRAPDTGWTSWPMSIGTSPAGSLAIGSERASERERKINSCNWVGSERWKSVGKREGEREEGMFSVSCWFNERIHLNGEKKLISSKVNSARFDCQCVCLCCVLSLCVARSTRDLWVSSGCNPIEWNA